jgi:Fic-DOC domain mobile mystery protein B
MGLEIEYFEGQTPLDDEEKDGLLISTISNRGELDEFEQQNIELAIIWTISRSFKPAYIFSEEFIKLLHKKMYSTVWRWAGKFRNSNKNLGIDHWQIPIQLKYLLDDAIYWYENNTYPPDEIALRFKHRLVSVHCFPNGNGRHSRLIADVIITNLYGKSVFTWGASNLSNENNVRTFYLKALKSADMNNYKPLIEFARS